MYWSIPVINNNVVIVSGEQLRDSSINISVFILLKAQMVKSLPAMQETPVRSLGQEDPLEKGMATYSSILAWRVPCTEGPGGDTVHGVTKSWTRLTRLSSSSSRATNTLFICFSPNSPPIQADT